MKLFALSTCANTGLSQVWRPSSSAQSFGGVAPNLWSIQTQCQVTFKCTALLPTDSTDQLMQFLKRFIRVLQPRMVAVAMGRRDGSSQSRDQERQRKWKSETNKATGRQYYEEQNSTGEQQQPQQQRRRQSRYEAEDDDEGPGWWERPEERSLEAYRPAPLDDWQVKRLEQAYAIGRKKVKVCTRCMGCMGRYTAGLHECIWLAYAMQASSTIPRHCTASCKGAAMQACSGHVTCFPVQLQQ